MSSVLGDGGRDGAAGGTADPLAMPAAGADGAGAAGEVAVRGSPQFRQNLALRRPIQKQPGHEASSTRQLGHAQAPLGT